MQDAFKTFGSGTGTSEPVWREVAKDVAVSYAPGYAMAPPTAQPIGSWLVKIGPAAGDGAWSELDGLTLVAMAFAEAMPEAVVWAALHLARCRAGVGLRPYGEILAGATHDRVLTRLAWLIEMHGHLYARDAVLSTRDRLVLRRVADGDCIELVAQSAGMRAQRVRLRQYDSEVVEFFAVDGQV